MNDSYQRKVYWKQGRGGGVSNFSFFFTAGKQRDSMFGYVSACYFLELNL